MPVKGPSSFRFPFEECCVCSLIFVPSSKRYFYSVTPKLLFGRRKKGAIFPPSLQVPWRNEKSHQATLYITVLEFAIPLLLPLQRRRQQQYALSNASPHPPSVPLGVQFSREREGGRGRRGLYLGCLLPPFPPTAAVSLRGLSAAYRVCKL